MGWHDEIHQLEESKGMEDKHTSNGDNTRKPTYSTLGQVQNDQINKVNEMDIKVSRFDQFSATNKSQVIDCIQDEQKILNSRKTL